MRCGDVVRDGVTRLFRTHVKAPARLLKVSEVASLGERRFVAVVQCGEERFLIGGAGASVNLLSRLQAPTGFSAELEESMTRLESAER